MSKEAQVLQLRASEPVQDVVAIAEKLLAEAKSGRIRAIAVAADMGDGTKTWMGGLASDRTHVYFALKCLQDQMMSEARADFR